MLVVIGEQLQRAGVKGAGLVDRFAIAGLAFEAPDRDALLTLFQLIATLTF